MSRKRKEVQEELPGMQDRRIEELHTAALLYASKRDERMALGRVEAQLKDELQALMHKHEKESYIFEGVEVRLVKEEETVKVKVKESATEERPPISGEEIADLEAQADATFQ